MHQFKAVRFRQRDEIRNRQETEHRIHQIFVSLPLAKKCPQHRNKERCKPPVEKLVECIARRKKFEHLQVTSTAKHSRRFLESQFRIGQVSHSKSVQNDIERCIPKGHLHRIELHGNGNSLFAHSPLQHSERKIPKYGHVGRSIELLVSSRKIARSTAKIQQAFSRAHPFQFATTTAAPQDILKAAQRMIQKIIAVGDFVEHLAHGAFHGAKFRKKEWGAMPHTPFQMPTKCYYLKLA